jgi:hypothetical protein
MRTTILVVLLFSVSSGVLVDASDSLPNPFSALVASHPVAVVIGKSSVKEGSLTTFDVTDAKTVTIKGSKPWSELFFNAVTRDLQRDRILLSARTTVVVFLDESKKPIAGFLYLSQTRFNKNVLEPIIVSQDGKGYSFEVMNEYIAKLQGIDLNTASREERIAAGTVRYIPISDLVNKYAGDDVTDSFPRKL